MEPESPTVSMSILKIMSKKGILRHFLSFTFIFFALKHPIRARHVDKVTSPIIPGAD